MGVGPWYLRPAGLGDTFDRLVPMVGTEEVFAGSQVRTIACGGEHTMGVTESGELGRGASERMDDWASI